MHAQIKHVISRLVFQSSADVIVELSAGEQTPLGKLLNRLYYRTNVMDVLDSESRYGYPHNGGQHTFTFRGTPRDAVAMVELFKEVLQEQFTLTEEESQVCSELSYISQEILAGRRRMI